MRSVVKERKIVEYNGSLKNLLEELCSKYSVSNIKQVHQHLLNDKDVRYLDGLETKLNNEDVVKLIPAVAG